MQAIRQTMIESLARKGISSGALLAAMGRVPRHLFVSEALRYRAYEDVSLPIGFGQTISKPSVIARMVQALGLDGDERVLEIGSGSGYQTAVLAELAASVVTLERIADLYRRARDILILLNYPNVTILHGDDPVSAPGTYDAIVVAAGAPAVPGGLLELLNPGGRLIIPLTGSSGHVIRKYVRKRDGGIAEESVGEAHFVPYIAGSAART